MSEDAHNRPGRRLSNNELRAMSAVRLKGEEFIHLVDGFSGVPKREYELAKTRIEEAVMWAIQGVASDV